MSTTSLDAAATDAAEARATGAAPLAQLPAPKNSPPTAAAAPPEALAAAAAASAVASPVSSMDGQPAGGDAPAVAGAGAPVAAEQQQQQQQQQPLLDPRNLRLLVQLQHKWAGHQLRHRVAAAAQGLGASIGAARSLVSPFHPFGEQWYISEAGVVAPGEVPADGPMSDATQAFAAANPGIINFHRCGAGGGARRAGPAQARRVLPAARGRPS